MSQDQSNLAGSNPNIQGINPAFKMAVTGSTTLIGTPINVPTQSYPPGSGTLTFNPNLGNNTVTSWQPYVAPYSTYIDKAPNIFSVDHLVEELFTYEEQKEFARENGYSPLIPGAIDSPSNLWYKEQHIEEDRGMTVFEICSKYMKARLKTLLTSKQPLKMKLPTV